MPKNLAIKLEWIGNKLCSCHARSGDFHLSFIIHMIIRCSLMLCCSSKVIDFLWLPPLLTGIRTLLKLWLELCQSLNIASSHLPHVFRFSTTLSPWSVPCCFIRNGSLKRLCSENVLYSCATPWVHVSFYEFVYNGFLKIPLPDDVLPPSKPSHPSEHV